MDIPSDLELRLGLLPWEVERMRNDIREIDRLLRKNRTYLDQEVVEFHYLSVVLSENVCGDYCENDLGMRVKPSRRDYVSVTASPSYPSAEETDNDSLVLSPSAEPDKFTYRDYLIDLRIILNRCAEGYRMSPEDAWSLKQYESPFTEKISLEELRPIVDFSREVIPSTPKETPVLSLADYRLKKNMG